MKCKVGKVSYLNTMPLFYSWKDKEIELVEGHPSYLAEMLRSGFLHAGIVSSIEYLMHPELYKYVPTVSISSRDRVCSVLLFSWVPIKEVKRVYLTPNSLTSKYLAIYVLEEMYSVRPQYTQEREEADCLLLIGDEALHEKKKGRSPYTYDLANEWYKVHKLPFVFALFLVRKDAPEWLSERIERLCHISRESFYKDLLEGKLRVEGFSHEELVEYFTKCLKNDLGSDELKSLEIFMDFLSSKGYIQT